jgi:hypothetical protein
VGTDVLTWDNGFFASLSLGENGTVIVAARFADTLTSVYSGYNLVQIEVYVGDIPVLMSLQVFDEGTNSSAGSLIYSQDVRNLLIPDAYNTFVVNPPIQITGNDIWIGYEVALTAMQYVMGLDNGPVHSDGDWIFDSLNPSFGWYHLSDFNFNNNWGIRGYVTNTVPVELTSFTGKSNDGNVILSWSTATETNNQGFEILRSTQNDNNEWKKIGFVSGHGTTTETQHYSFTDNDIKPDKYQYKLKQIDYDGTFEYSQIVEVEVPFVNQFSLAQNYPNPFNPITNIEFRIAGFGFVTLKVYDILGREIATLVNEEKPAGEYEVEFNAVSHSGEVRNLTSGIYFYKLQAGSVIETKKMILLK